MHRRLTLLQPLIGFGRKERLPISFGYGLAGLALGENVEHPLGLAGVERNPHSIPGLLAVRGGTEKEDKRGGGEADTTDPLHCSWFHGLEYAGIGQMLALKYPQREFSGADHGGRLCCRHPGSS